MNQQTINESFSVKGKGLHSGIEITAVFNPADENTGYRFRRVIFRNNLLSKLSQRM